MILQGSNSPITLTFENDISTATKFSAVLVAGGRIVKTWTLTDVVIAAKKAMLPLTETETASFPAGQAALDVKLTQNNVVIFAQTVKMTIVPRNDKNIRMVTTT